MPARAYKSSHPEVFCKKDVLRNFVFLLYTGPLALKSIIDKNLYQHFMTLHVTMSILLNSSNE